MAKIEVSCQVTCQKCGWGTGATIPADERDVLEEVLKFIRGCAHQHLSSGFAGELVVIWKPLELEGR